MKESPERLAEDHWEWIEGLWESLPAGAVFGGLVTTEYLYKTAFIHGYKHGVKDVKNDENMPKM